MHIIYGTLRISEYVRNHQSLFLWFGKCSAKCLWFPQTWLPNAIHPLQESAHEPTPHEPDEIHIVSSCFISFPKKQWPNNSQTNFHDLSQFRKNSFLGVLTPLGWIFPWFSPLGVSSTESLQPRHGGVLEFRNPKLTVPKLILSTSNSNLSQQKKVGKAWGNQDTLRFGSE